MAQQRARLEAMRQRKLAEQLAQAKAAKRLAPSKPKSGKKATEALNKFLTKASKKGAAQSGSTTPKAAGTKPVQAKTKTPPKKSQVQKAVKAVKKASDKAVRNKKAIRNSDVSVSGTRGTPLPSNPQLKSQSKKSKLNPQQRRKAGQIKRPRGMSPADAAKSISDKLRLTYKKGQIVERGGKFYKSDGKGGLTLVHIKHF